MSGQSVGNYPMSQSLDYHLPVSCVASAIILLLKVWTYTRVLLTAFQCNCPLRFYHCACVLHHRPWFFPSVRSLRNGRNGL